MIYTRQSFTPDHLVSLKGIVFDCDGVLLDSRDANISFYNYVRSRFNLPELTKDQEDYVHMATFQQALDYAVPKEHRHLLQPILEQASIVCQYTSRLTIEEGTHQFLDWLQSKGLKMGICTNRADNMDSFLKMFKINTYFAPFQTVTNSEPKPSPDGLNKILSAWGVKPNEIAFIGDSYVDYQAALSANVPFWAFKNNELNAALHIKGFPQLLDMLKQYIS